MMRAKLVCHHFPQSKSHNFRDKSPISWENHRDPTPIRSQCLFWGGGLILICTVGEICSILLSCTAKSETYMQACQSCCAPIGHLSWPCLDKAYQIFKLIKILNVVPMRMHLLFFNKSCQSVQRDVKWMQVYRCIYIYLYIYSISQYGNQNYIISKKKSDAKSSQVLHHLRPKRADFLGDPHHIVLNFSVKNSTWGTPYGVLNMGKIPDFSFGAVSY